MQPFDTPRRRWASSSFEVKFTFLYASNHLGNISAITHSLTTTWELRPTCLQALESVDGAGVSPFAYLCFLPSVFSNIHTLRVLNRSEEDFLTNVVVDLLVLRVASSLLEFTLGACCTPISV